MKKLILLLIIIFLSVYSCDNKIPADNTVKLGPPDSIVLETIPAVNNQVVLTATVRDADSNPLPDQSLIITSDGSLIKIMPENSRTTDSSGMAKWGLRSMSVQEISFLVTLPDADLSETVTIALDIGSVVSGGVLQQPNGVSIPSNLGYDGENVTGLAVVLAHQCVDEGAVNIGGPCVDGNCEDGQNSTCETTLWHVEGDNPYIPSMISGINPQTNSSITPMAMEVVSELKVQLLSRGSTSFLNGFGWYNATGSMPDYSELYQIFDGTAAEDSEFIVDILNSPNYLGGRIGFFLITPESFSGGSCADSDCVATAARVASGEGFFYFSEYQYNPDENGNESYIHLLLYESHIWNSTFYYAWDDTFNGGNNDFTDLVVRVTGVDDLYAALDL